MALGAIERRVGYPLDIEYGGQLHGTMQCVAEAAEPTTPGVWSASLWVYAWKHDPSEIDRNHLPRAKPLPRKTPETPAPLPKPRAKGKGR